MIAEIIRWGLLIFLLILIVVQLSSISNTIRTMQHLMVILLAHLSHPEIFKDFDIEKAFKEVIDDDDD